MMSDTDLLAMIKSLGGQPVHHDGGEFWAVFDREFALSANGSIETRQPSLTARTSDVQSLAKDSVLRVGDEVYRLKRPEPDGTGVTLLILKT